MKKPDKESDNIQAAEGFAAFCDQFGSDNSIHKRVLLEVFFEELLNGTTVHLPGEEGQEGCETDRLLELDEENKPDPINGPEDS